MQEPFRSVDELPRDVFKVTGFLTVVSVRCDALARLHVERLNRVHHAWD